MGILRLRRAPNRPQNRPQIGLFWGLFQAPPGRALGHLNVRERVFPNIWAQKGPQIGPPGGPIWDPLLEGPWEAPGHLNVRERGFGPIPAQKGPKRGPKRGLQEAPNRPFWGPFLRPNPLLCPHVLRVYCSDMGSQEGPQEGPGGPILGPCFEAKSLAMPPCFKGLLLQKGLK